MGSASGQEIFVVNTGFTPPVSTFFQLVVEEAFGRLQIPVFFQVMSAERSLQLVNRGIDDAECCRIPDAIRADYPGLLSVPVSFYTATFSAFTKDPALQIRNWQDLKPYSVGVVTGWKILVDGVAKVEPAGYTMVDSPEALFKMLDLGRIDIATLGYRSGLQVIDNQGVEGIHVLEPPLAQRALHMQLHPRHADLLPRITKVLLDMEADGTIARLRMTALGN
ncbi:MAG: transporter substrate-binding domain-containing protein [Proteobacteria bacterium]|nr:transporter substrate-binding domain-containing protein [Pseudomonadota bacterium]